MNYFADLLKTWVDVHARDLESDGISATLAEGPSDRDKRVAWVDLHSATRSVRLAVWASGEAVLSVGDLTTGAVIAEEQVTLAEPSDLERTIGSAVAWATG